MPRRLGQHHLFDPTILDRIVDAIDPQPDDTVIEIGSGTGSLTKRLASRVGRVIAIEKDVQLVKRLRQEEWGAERGHANVEIVEGDALRVDWHELIRGTSSGITARSELTVKIIGNIPYYISSPLIDKAFTAPLPAVIVFLLQAEVAARVVAKPGSKAYGALSVGVQVIAGAERVFSVPAGAFRPPPKVESAVLRLVPLASPLVESADRAAFRRFVVGVFSQRRKQLARVVSAVCGISRDTAAERLRALGLEPTARPEVVAAQDFVRLFRRGAR